VKTKLFAIALCSILAVACKQGEGEHCQVSADCSSPLVCNQASLVCVSTGNSKGDVDAPLPPSDAAPGATPDAMPDAP
jgi:hypothetical protein